MKNIIIKEGSFDMFVKEYMGEQECGFSTKSRLEEGMLVKQGGSLELQICDTISFIFVETKHFGYKVRLSYICEAKSYDDLQFKLETKDVVAEVL